MSTSSSSGLPLKTYLARLIWWSMLPLVLLAAWLAWQHVVAGLAQRDLAAVNLARNFATALDQRLDARIRALNMLAISPLMDDRTRWPELYREAQGFQQSFDSHVILADVGKPMHMLFNTRVPYGQPLPLLPVPKGHAAAPVALATGKPAVGDSFMGPVANTPLVAIAVPVLRQGKVVHVLVNTFATSSIQGRLNQFSLPADWAMSVLDGRGEVIARRGPPGFDPARDVDPAGRFVVRSALSHWSVALEIPRATRRADLFGTGIALALGLLGASLAGALAGLTASRRLGRAVASLSETRDAAEAAPDIAEISAARNRLDAVTLDLRAGEERYRRLFQDAPIPMGQVGHDGSMLALNARFTEVFGYTLADLPTIDDWWRLAYPDPDYRARVMAGWSAAVAGAAASGRDFESSDDRTVTCKDGSQRIVQISGRVMPEGVLATFLDVTERRQAEGRLRLWAESFEHAQFGLAISDARNNTFVAVNPTFARERGYSREDMVGMPIRAVFPVEIQAQVREQIAAVDRTSHGSFESEHVCRDGRRFPVLLDISVIQDATGRPANRVAYVLDLTERKRVERELRDVQAQALEQQNHARIAALNQMQDANAARTRAEAAMAAMAASETKLQAALASMGEAVCITDAEGRFIEFNEAFATFHKFRDKPECPRTFAEYPDLLDVCFANSEPAPVQEWAVPRALRGEVASNEEYGLRRRDTGETWVGSYSYAPIRGPDGGIVGSVVVARDITEKKRVEEELNRLNSDLERRVLERTSELAAANRELESFAYAVSHDLRAPLRAMTGFTQALVEDFGGQLTDEARGYLEQIEIAGRRMGGLIDGILVLSRITRGELQRDAVDLSDMATRLLQELAREEPDRLVALDVAAGLQARGDARMLEALMTNLLGNAWKYTGHTASPQIRVYAEDRNDGRWYCVADNGAGFDLAHANRLFQPFQRLHRQDEFPGIGIGLATVQRIVHRHGGEIEATGEVNKGATFCFKLATSATGA